MAECESNNIFRDEKWTIAVRNATEKIAAGDRLTAEDMISLANWEGYHSRVMDHAEKFLNGLGIDKGTDFDVRMPTVSYLNGEPYYEPMSVSFKNEQGETTRIDFIQNVRYDAETDQMVPCGEDEFTITASEGSGVVGVGEQNGTELSAGDLDKHKYFSVNGVIDGFKYQNFDDFCGGGAE